MKKVDVQNHIESDTQDNGINHEEYQDIFCKSIYPISNGEKITINIGDSQSTLFVVASTSTGIVFSNEIIIETDSSNASYLLQTKYSFAKGSSYLLSKKSG